MKFCSTLLPAAGFLAVVSAANPSGCLDAVVEGTDYFEHKVEPMESLQWSIEYNKTYKVVTNLAADETYLLYQCGTEPPTDQMDGRHAAVVLIPFTDAAIIFTTMVPFFELLGIRNKISTYLGSAQYVASPCLRELVDEGKVTEVINTKNQTDYEGVSPALPAFIGNVGERVLLENNIRISASEETGNLPVFEWIKYYSVFFNLEDKANEIFEEVQSRYECVESNAAILESDMQAEPVVLWGAYSAYCDGGWDVARCPEYYCEFASACSAKILSSFEGSIQSERCGRNYMTTEEFVAFGKDADIWIYTGNDANSVLDQFKEELKDFVSVKNETVYDTLASGSSAWFEYRLAEPGKFYDMKSQRVVSTRIFCSPGPLSLLSDVVLQDFCSVVGTENELTPHTRSWIRHVYGDPVGDLGQCTDVDAPLVTKANTCVALPAIQKGSSAAGVASFLWMLLAAAVLA